MAQDPDLVTGDALSNRDASTDTYTPDDQRDPAAIGRDIERTRAEMSETIDAIGARFQPEYIKEQAKEAIRDTARSAGTSMFDTIRDNPLPAAIAGMSIAWLFAHASSGDRRDDRRSGGDRRYGGDYGGGPGYDRYGTYGPYDGGGSYGDGSGDASLRDRAGEAVGDVRDRATDALGSAKDRASDFGDRATDEARHLQQQAEQTGHRAMTWLEDQMDRNPLGVGAVALAAGALVGLSLPTTDAEQNLFGAPAQQLKSRVEEAASETLDKAKEVASSVADEAKQKAGEVADAAKEKASDVADTAKDQAWDMADTAKSEAKGAMSGGYSPGGSTAGGSTAGNSSMGGSASGVTTGHSDEHVANVNDPELSTKPGPMAA